MEPILSDPFAKMRVEQTVEILCQRGCEYVREAIRHIEDGNVRQVIEIRETDDAGDVLCELKAIMSVYDSSGGSCCPVPGVRGLDADIKKASR